MGVRTGSTPCGTLTKLPTMLPGKKVRGERRKEKKGSEEHVAEVDGEGRGETFLLALESLLPELTELLRNVCAMEGADHLAHILDVLFGDRLKDRDQVNKLRVVEISVPRLDGDSISVEKGKVLNVLPIDVLGVLPVQRVLKVWLLFRQSHDDRLGIGAHGARENHDFVGLGHVREESVKPRPLLRPVSPFSIPLGVDKRILEAQDQRSVGEGGASFWRVREKLAWREPCPVRWLHDPIDPALQP
eukprot:761439-Hanusia_phi.AAC.4